MSTNRYQSISNYAKLCGISRESVYKRIKRGTAVLLANCDVPVIDTYLSKGSMQRNNWKDMPEPNNTPDWMKE